METLQLILKYLSGKASQDDRKAMETWMSESNDNKSLFEDIKSIDEQSNSLQNINLIDTDVEWNAFMSKVNSSESAKVIDLPTNGKVKNLSTNVFRRRVALSAAASLILILGAIFLFPNKFKEIHTGDMPFAMTLDDGTKIDLAANSYLKYPLEFATSAREIFINGTAKIDIAKDPSKPFTIKSPLTGVEVLGTTIDLEASDDASTLGVIEGNVSMFPAGKKSEAMLLKTGDIVRYTSAGFEVLTEPEVVPEPEPEPEVVPEPEPEPEVVPEPEPEVVPEPEPEVVPEPEPEVVPEPEPEVVPEPEPEVVPEPEPEVVPEPEPEVEEIPRGKFKMGTFIDYLKKTHPEKDNFKLKGGVKYDKNDTINVSISAPLSTILKQLEEKYIIEYSDDCDGCFEIKSMIRKK